MMIDFEIRFGLTNKGMDMRPPGARELLEALYEVVHNDETLTAGDAADAHNYICALEARVTQLYHQLHRMQDQHRIDVLFNKKNLGLVTDLLLLSPPSPFVLPLGSVPGSAGQTPGTSQSR
jgi:hypothetical protein